MRLDHFNIAAPPDLMAKVRQFYVEVLGFEEGFRPEFQRRGYWLYAEGRPAVHLIESDRHSDSGGRGYLDHVAFRSNGLADFLERLKTHGVKFRRSHIDEFEMTQIFIEDPAGTGLEINFPGES